MGNHVTIVTPPLGRTPQYHGFLKDRALPDDPDYLNGARLFDIIVPELDDWWSNIAVRYYRRPGRWLGRAHDTYRNRSKAVDVGDISRRMVAFWTLYGDAYPCYKERHEALDWRFVETYARLEREGMRPRLWPS